MTLTITMVGYDIDPVTGGFRGEAADIRADLARAAGAPPVSALGYRCDAHARRRAAGHAPPWMTRGSSRPVAIRWAGGRPSAGRSSTIRSTSAATWG